VDPGGENRMQGLLVGIAEIDPLWFAHDSARYAAGQPERSTRSALHPVPLAIDVSRTPPTGA
jgi:hypothetical protein